MIDRISDNFYSITLPMPFRLRHVRVYALVCGRDVALFDAGLNLGGAYEILEKDLQSMGLGINYIRNIYITHAHTDHSSLAGLLKSKSGARIHLTAAADSFLQHFRKLDLLNRQASQFYLRHGLTVEQMETLFAVYSSIAQIICAFDVDEYLQDGEIREFGGRNFEVIFTPGHSPGHACFFFRREKLILSGDHILPHITPNLSPDIFDESFRPLNCFLRSLEKLKDLPVERVYPGHGPSFRGLTARLNELRAHHQRRSELIKNCLHGRPKTAWCVSQEIFGENLPDFDQFLAVNETYVHLLELKHMGLVKEELADGVFVYANEQKARSF